MSAMVVDKSMWNLPNHQWIFVSVIKNGKNSSLLGPLLSKCIMAMCTVIEVFPVAISRWTCSLFQHKLLLSCC